MTSPTPSEFEGFAASLRSGRLSFPRCRGCGRFHWYPKPLCPHCRSAAIDWQPVRGAGEIYSFTVVRHAFEEKWRPALPYVVALVTFADAPGIRFITNIVDVAPESVRIGDAVEPMFPIPAEGEARVLFRLLKCERR